jgi:hypothetical protein
MKKLFYLTSVLFLFSFISIVTSISDKEREFATGFLGDTENSLIQSVKGLSDAQLKFRPAPDRWSVEDCLMHIAFTENALWKAAEMQVKQPANPALRAEIKSTDEQVINMIADRSNKVKTPEPFEPKNTSFKTAAQALDSFKVYRANLVNYVKNTKDDLRNHVVTLPFAKFDSYQMILFVGAHGKRHTQQIEEIKADPNFPGN